MSKGLLVWIFCSASLLAQNTSGNARSQAGCGSASEKFSVKTDKKSHAFGTPSPGKALVYVIVVERYDPHYPPITHETTRVGIDGTWVGANHGQSYFSISLDPGDHQVCSDVQSMFTKNLAAATDLSAESGKTYYLRAEVTIPAGDLQAGMKLHAVDDAECKLLISQAALSASKEEK
jgi:hypothetical protein